MYVWRCLSLESPKASGTQNGLSRLTQAEFLHIVNYFRGCGWPWITWLKTQAAFIIVEIPRMGAGLF